MPGGHVRFRFQDQEIDVDRREHRRGGRLVRLEPQVFDLLVYLVQNRSRVVSKDDLIEGVWGGRIVSDSTLTSRITAVRKAIGDSGGAQRLLSTVPRKGFRFVAPVREDDAQRLDIAKLAADVTPPDIPSIAVLPFQNLSGGGLQDYFADGMVDDIITELSRIRWLFVIGRGSSFTFARQPADARHVGRALGVRYVLEGSIRKARNRVRLTGQLIDTGSGAHLWGDRFEGALQDVFELQDRLRTSVVGALVPRLEWAEIERAKRKPTESLDAYDVFLRGLASFYRRTKEANRDALQLFYRAIAIDPEFATPYAMAAWCVTWSKINGWLVDREAEIAEGSRLARRAVELGQEDAVALARAGHALGFLVGDLDTGLDFVERALLLNPNLAVAWVLSGLLQFYRGECEIAIKHLAWAMRLSPLDPTLYQMHVGTGFAHLLAGRQDEACSWAGKALRQEPDYLPAAAVVAASNALGGRMREARQAMTAVRRIDPALTIANLKQWFPLSHPDQFARWSEGLRLAGLPV
jgi:TolB-like protein